MDHRQRMLAGNKIQQMLNNESYKEFPDMCRNYALNVMKKLAPSKVVRTYEIHLREAPIGRQKNLKMTGFLPCLPFCIFWQGKTTLPDSKAYLNLTKETPNEHRRLSPPVLD